MAEKSNAKSKSKPAPAGKKAAAKATKKAGKPTAAKSEPSKPAKAKAAKTKTTPPADVATYYVSYAIVPAAIHDAPPAAGGPFAEFSSFDEAREGLLEHLIELIEAFEHRLHSVRRIGSFTDYRELGS
jgi:hypothetical protein